MPPITGSSAWGRSTGVAEDNTRTFLNNWTGTGAISSSGDSEQVCLEGGELMDSEIVNTGTKTVSLALNQYDAGDSAAIYYRHAATEADVASAIWQLYSAPFDSLGYVQVSIGELVYLLRDQFLTDDANPVTSPRTCEPGPGTITVSDVEGTIFIQNDRLRGMGQPTSPVWGDSRLVSDAFIRTQGRAFVVKVIPEDFSQDYAFLWATSNTPGTPDTAGNGMRNIGGKIDLLNPSGVVRYDDVITALMSLQYLIVLVQQAAGCYVLVSSAGTHTNLSTSSSVFGDVPAYPSARLWWVDRASTTSPLYAVISQLGSFGPPGPGVSVEDLRVIDLREADWTVQDGLALVRDTFSAGASLASHTSDSGHSWTVGGGTWTISGGKVSRTDGANNEQAAVLVPQTADYLVQCKMTTPDAGGTTLYGIVLRYQDATNYIALLHFSGITRLAKVVAGAISSIADTGYGRDNATTYEMRCYVEGSRYRVFQDNTIIMDVTTDTTFQGNAGAGFITNGQNAQPSFDDFAVFPLEVTLPSEIQRGDVPDVLIPGSIVASDSFTDTDGTRLNAHTAASGGAWTEHRGVWTINSNRVGAATVDFFHNPATQSLGVSDAECEAVIHTHGDGTGTIWAGIILRCNAAADDFIMARLLMEAAQPDADEIEIIEFGANFNTVVRKTQVGNYYQPNSNYTLKLQIKGDLLHVFLDGSLVISHYLYDTHAGTRFGLVLSDGGVQQDGGCTFDTWQVKAL